MDNKIDINDDNIQKLILFNDSIIYLQKQITGFNPNLLLIEICKSNLFEFFISKSYDNINWSELKTLQELIDEYDIIFDEHINEGELTQDKLIDQNLIGEKIYISIWCKQYKNVDDVNDIPDTMYQQENIDNTKPEIIFSGIDYDNDIIFDLSKYSKDIKIQSIYQLINQFPKWNFYDNQQITINRWKEQCNALAESYGHTCIYFKTTPIEVNNTLAVNVVRNVTSIKKLHIMFPNNELPQDRVVFSEWDMGLQDDFITHIIIDKFEQAFGKHSIPEQRDYLYLPIINKIFRVTASQPKSGFMGRVCWWEVFLAKYEEDECVVIEDDLKRAMGGFPEINDAMDSVEQNYENMKLQNHEELKPLLDEIDIFKTKTVYTSEIIDEFSIDEKKKATQNFTDRLNDSTNFINVKETEAIKEFISKRLNIVSINPENNIYPVTMYNCTECSNRTVALTYNITDFIKTNKKSNVIFDSYDFNFNYVMNQKFSGEVFDLVSKSTNEDGTVILTIEQNRNKTINLILHNYQKTFNINFTFIEKTFYQICINFKRNIQPTKNQIAIKIFSVVDKQKKLEYQNTYIIELVNEDKIFDIDKIFLYGGKFFTNDIELNIDNKNIIMDNVNPVVQMNKFGL